MLERNHSFFPTLTGVKSFRNLHQFVSTTKGSFLHYHLIHHFFHITSLKVNFSHLFEFTVIEEGPDGLSFLSRQIVPQCHLQNSNSLHL